MEKKVLDLFENAPWDQIIPELLRYSLYKIRQKLFCNNSILKGMYPRDIASDVVMESIKKVLDGTRTWDPDEKDNLTIHLKSIIKSEISRLGEDKETEITERFPTKNNSDDDPVEVEELLNIADPQEEHAADIMPSLPLNPEELESVYKLTFFCFPDMKRHPESRHFPGVLCSVAHE